MKLHVQFDDAMLLASAQRGSASSFIIFWSHEGETYPDEMWSDFGAVLLSQWLTACADLRFPPAKVRLEFMEGPSAIEAVSTDEGVRMDGLHSSFSCLVPVETLIAELLNIGEQICYKCAQLGIEGADLVSLRAMIDDHKRFRASQASFNQ